MKKALLFLTLLLAAAAYGTITGIITQPGGSNGDVQYNKNGTFGGDSSFTYSTSTHHLTLAGILESTSGGIKFPDGTTQTSAVSLSYPITVAHGGTGQDWSGVTAGSLLYFSATGVLSTLSAGTNGYVLEATGAGAPVWVSSGIFAGGGSMAIGGTVTGATSGSLLFSSGTALQQDNANLFYDYTNQRLGVGTNAPTHTLEVSGTLEATTLLGNGSGVFNLQAGNINGQVPIVNGGTGANTLGGAFISTGTGTSTLIPIYDSSSSFRTYAGFSHNGTTLTVTGVSASTVQVSGGIVFPDGTRQTTAASGSSFNQVISLSTGVTGGPLSVANGGTGATTLGGAFISTGTGVTSRIPFYASTSAFTTDSALTYSGGTLSATTFSGSGASLTSLPAGQLTGQVAVANGGTGATTLGGAFISTGTGVTNDVAFWASTSAFKTNDNFNYNGTTMSASAVSASTISASIQVQGSTVIATGRLIMAGGSTSAPGLTTSGALTTGFTIVGSAPEIDAGGTKVFNATSSGNFFYVQMECLTNSPTAPCYSFTDTGTGIYSSGTGNLVFMSSTGNLAKMQIRNNTASTIIKVGTGTANAGLAGTFYVSTGVVTNSGTGETNLVTSTMPAASLPQAQDAIVLEVGGTFASNANSKQVKVYFGSTAIYDSTSLVLNGGTWFISCKVARVSATSQISYCTDFSSNVALANSVQRTTPTADLTGAVNVRVTGTGGASSDISEDLVAVEYKPAP